LSKSSSLRKTGEDYSGNLLTGYKAIVIKGA